MRNCKRQGGAPFPYFGGKARVAAEVWAALGEPHHYLEPFFGSGAVLLARPQPSAAGIETVCDADGYLCNVWRALRADPDTVAQTAIASGSTSRPTAIGRVIYGSAGRSRRLEATRGPLRGPGIALGSTISLHLSPRASGEGSPTLGQFRCLLGASGRLVKCES